MDYVSSLLSLFSSSSSSSTSTNTDRKSVFDDHYIPTSKALMNDEDWRKKTYLQLSYSSISSILSTLGSSNNILSGLLGGVSGSTSTSTSTTTTFSESDFWELIVTEYTESHNEKYGAHNALSESFCWFATGPKPVEISLTALFMTSDTKDWRTYFMYVYTAALRAKQLTNNQRTLTLVMKDTTMLLYIKSMAFTETSELPGYSTVTINAIAYKYKNVFSQDPAVVTSYAGTETEVPTTTAGETTQIQYMTLKNADTTTSSAGTVLYSELADHA